MSLSGVVITLIIFAWAMLGLAALDAPHDLQGWLTALLGAFAKPAFAFTLFGACLVVLGLVSLPFLPLLRAFFVAFSIPITGVVIFLASVIVFLEYFNGRRPPLATKKRIIRQMASTRHPFALKAVQLARENGWLEDGSLESVDLVIAHLQNAHLEGAHLESAHLAGTHLESAHLEGAHLADAHLESAHLEGALLGNADLDGALLIGAYLDDAVLSDAHLAGAHLIVAHLTRARLKGAYLAGADLRAADLKNADLREANLQNADLRSADLSYADLQGVSLTGTKYNYETIWPMGFDPQVAGALWVADEYAGDPQPGR